MSEKEISEKMQDIMKRMKDRREELNMSYQTLSEKVGISKSTLQRYETGYIKNMPVDKLGEIADALQVSPAYLMGWEQIDNNFSGKEAPSETYDKLKKNIEKFHGTEGELISIYNKLSSGNQNKVMQYSKNLLYNQRMEEELSSNTAHVAGQPTTIAAHFDGDEYTDGEMDEIKRFAELAKNRKK